MNSAARKILPTPIQNEASLEKKSFSSRIYGIDWSKYFPLKIADDEEIRMVDYTTAMNFVKENHAEIFELEQWGNPFFKEELTAAKQCYYEEVADCFLFYKGDLCYGLHIGNPIDWASYYIRYSALKKEFRNQGRSQAFTNYLINTLRENSIARIEIDIAPSNLPNIHIHNKLQFNINGITLSERWGALLHFTKILNPAGEKVFLDRFCVGNRPQIEDQQANVISINNHKTRRIL